MSYTNPCPHIDHLNKADGLFNRGLADQMPLASMHAADGNAVISGFLTCTVLVNSVIHITHFFLWTGQIEADRVAKKKMNKYK